MGKLKSVIKHPRTIILIAFLILAVVAINPAPWKEGVAIRSVMQNSSASMAGIESPKPAATPRSREVIISMNNRPIRSVKDYHEFVDGLDINRTVKITTDKDVYRLKTLPEYNVTELNETETRWVEETVQVNKTVNGTVQLVNETVRKQVEVPKTEKELAGMEDPGLRIYEAPTTNIRKGLDLQGGTRVLLKPERKLDKDEMEMLLANMKERLNIYGLTDITVRETSDLSGNQYILVEIAGATEEDIQELLARQGKFEAKIGNSTVFRGGGDITYVCRSAECSGLDSQKGCGRTSEGNWVCRFRFSISLRPEAAERQAEATKDMEVVTENGEQYLSRKLNLYLDDSKVDSLNIGADLKGRPVTEISISGAGEGISREEATSNALKNMKRLQTVLITGSLPVKLEVVKTNTISPMLGEEFTKNALLIGFLAIIAVAVVILIRFKRIEITVPVIITMFSEVLLLLGLASLIGWNLDLAAIAGIIIAAGTGVDDQIVIIDEVMRGKGDITSGWKQKIKKAFFIIMAAYFTTVVAMVPLLFAGAGLLKGFAFTTIAGVSFGVFVTRPAFASTAEILLKK
ncbi:MAG: hypothetical protein R6U32_04560 [Candidatus Woesearchaeota archaeon]